MKTWTLFTVCLLALLAGPVGSATRDGFWYSFASTDTLFNQQAMTSQVFRVDGCEGVGWHFAGQGADSVTLTVQGSLDGSNWYTVETVALQDWSSGYTVFARSSTLSENGLDSEPPVAPTRWLRLGLTCSGDSASASADKDTLTNVTVGVTCGGTFN